MSLEEMAFSTGECTKRSGGGTWGEDDSSGELQQNLAAADEIDMSTPPLQYESKSTRPAWREADYYLLIIKGAAVYFLASALTLPFAASIWVGKIPLLALVQLP